TPPTTTTTTSTSSTTTTVTTTSTIILVTTSSSTTSTTHATSGAGTTSTTLASTCNNGAGSATFGSIICRIDALLRRVQGEPGLGKCQAKLAHTLGIAEQRAVDGRDLCAAGNTKKSKKRLAQTKQTVGQYVHRLSSAPARHKLDDILRLNFLGDGQAI